MEKNQIVYVEKNGYWNAKDDEIFICRVISKGPKYFKLEETNGKSRFSNEKFSLIEMHDVSIYSPSYRVYLTEKEILDKRERPDLLKSLDKLIMKITVDELKELKSHIEVKYINKD